MKYELDDAHRDHKDITDGRQLTMIYDTLLLVVGILQNNFHNNPVKAWLQNNYILVYINLLLVRLYDLKYMYVPTEPYYTYLLN